MKKLNQKGVAALEIVLIVFVVLAVAGVGYYVWQAKVKTNKTLDSTAQGAGDAQKSEKKEQLDTYDAKELGIKLKYPKDWGTVSLKDGVVMSPGTGSYKQLTFSKQSGLDINFVVGAYSSPLDGCGLASPVENMQHGLSSVRASVIGWDSTNIKRYMSGQGTPAKVYLYNVKPGDTGPGWVNISTSDKVLEYKDIDGPNDRIKVATGDEACGPVTQAQADEANAYKKFYHYAVNVSNSNYKGVNAQYDARTNDDSSVRSKLAEILNSIQ